MSLLSHESLRQAWLVCGDENRYAQRIRLRNAFGDAGCRVVIEEFLSGEEASFIVIADGAVALPMASSQDHKRIGEGDTGPNTGGMGAYAPAPALTSELHRETEERIIAPVLAEMQRMGCPFTGVLYCGLMLTEEGPKVVEFNARFGDPECQILLPLIQNDLLDILEAACDGQLDHIQIANAPRACVCVVMAAEGYPESYPKGMAISGLESLAGETEQVVFHAGTELRDGQLVTNGGRVLGVTALGDTIHDAVANAYKAVDAIHFDGAYYRRDIAHKALSRP